LRLCAKSTAAKKTELDRLTDSVKELNREIQILREASSKEFNLQIRQDTLRETQRTLESIVDLRRQLNLLQSPIPAGTEDAQLAALKAITGKGPRGALSLAIDLKPGFKFLDELGTPARPAEAIKQVAVELSNAERFMRGFGSATATVGEIFERFGQNVAFALTNVKDLLNGLKQSVLQFFNDLLGRSLQNLMAQLLGPLPGGGAGGGGLLGNLFRTPSLAGGISAPPSISLGPFGFGQGFGLGGGVRDQQHRVGSATS
jgi:hypothetical protein